MLVAMPTAIPDAPLTSTLGNWAGKTTGSSSTESYEGLMGDGALPQFGKQIIGQRHEPCLGVAAGGRRVAVEMAEIANDLRQAACAIPSSV